MKVTNLPGPNLGTNVVPNNDITKANKARALAKLQNATQEAFERPEVITAKTVSKIAVTPVSRELPMEAAAPAIAQTTAPMETLEPTLADPEAPVEEVKPIEPVRPTLDESLSRRYAALANRERAIRQRELELRAREDQFRAPTPVEKSAPDLSNFISKEELLSRPFEVMNKLGLTYDKLTDMAVNAPSQQELQYQSQIAALEEKINALQAKSEETLKTIEERESDNYTQAINMMKNDIKSLIESGTDYEMIRSTDSIDDVVDLIETTYKDTGVLPSIAEAAEYIENYLTNEALRLAKLTKIQSRMAPSAPVKQEPVEKTIESKPLPPKTLSNSMGTTRPLSARERAVLAFQGKLNK